METTIVLSLAYVILIGILYAPKCPATTATETAPIDYFPEIEEEDSEKIPEPLDDLSPAIAPSPSITSPDLATTTIRQLKAMAKGKIKNYGNLTKAQLIDRLALA